MSKLKELLTKMIDKINSAVIKPSNAKVGQTLVVKTVDDSGKPTEWEAADFPEGGSGSAATPDWSINDPSQPGYVANRTHYTIEPGYEITWNGDTTDRTMVDLTDMGYEGYYLVKVSDKVPNHDELNGCDLLLNTGHELVNISEEEISEMLPGCYVLADLCVAVVYSSDLVSAAIGAPEGYLTNGVYFMAIPSTNAYTSRLRIQGKVQPIDKKYLPDYIRNNVPRSLSPLFDVSWDGDMTDRVVIDGSQIGFDPGVYFVKVSDILPYIDEVYDFENGKVYIELSDGGKESFTLDLEGIDDTSFPGAIKIGEYGVYVYDATTLCSALGAPDGYIENGTYFTSIENEFHTYRITGREDIIYLDDKYISDNIARIYEVYDIVNQSVSIAIYDAIGGSY